MTLRKIIDVIFIPLIIFLCAFEPNFIHGFIDHLEAGQYLSVINEIFYGKVPIRDIFTLFGPLHIYLPALVMLLFGKSLGVLRAYFHFGTIFSLIIAYLLGKSICRSRFFSYLFAFLLVLEVNHPFWSSRWGGMRMGLGLLTLLFLVSFIKNRMKTWLLLAGILSSFSLLYSMEIGIFSFIVSVVAIIFVSFGEKKHRIFRGFKMFLLYLGGTLFIVTPFFIYFFIKGALRSYFVTSFIILPRYHLKVWGQPIPNFIPSNLNSSNFLYWLLSAHFKMFLPIFIYIAAILYITFNLVKGIKTNRLIIISILTIYGLLLYVSSFRVLQGPQFQTALPPLLILECLFLENCFLYCKKLFLQRSHRSNIKKIMIIFFLTSILFVSSIYLLFSEKRYYFSLKGWFLCQMHKQKLMPMYSMPTIISKIPLFPLEIERAKGIMVPKDQKEEIEGVTNFIIKNTEQNEPIFTFPEHGIYNFFADRPVVGRFPIAGFAWTTKEYQSELLKSIKEAKPRYVIFGKRLSNLAMSIGRKEEVLPEISEFIRENYILVKSFYTVDIYCRK